MVRKIIPKKVRIACFIVIAASLVVSGGAAHAGLRLSDLPEPGYLRAPHRGELHHPGPGRGLRGKNPVLHSAADGLGMGIGFTFSLTFLGAIREIFGTARYSGWRVRAGLQALHLIVEAPGAFVCMGLILGA
jgi:electron transport complex protein RnfE